jgi:hypothetical protein
MKNWWAIQESPLEIERRPVEKFNDESRPPHPAARLQYFYKQVAILPAAE